MSINDTAPTSITGSLNASFIENKKFIPLLHAAIAQGDSKKVSFLLEQGADIEEKFEGFSPLFLAIYDRQPEITSLLLSKGASFNADSEEYTNPLIQALLSGYKEIVKILLRYNVDLDAKNYIHMHPLSLAVKAQDESSVKLMLEQNIDVNVKDYENKTAIFHAIKEDILDSRYIHVDIEGNQRNTNILELLLEKGATIDLEDIYGRTPLSHAIEQGNKEATKLLLDKGDEAYLTKAFENAIRNGHSDVVEMTIDRGVDINEKDSYGMHYIYNVLYSGHDSVLKLFLNHNVDLTEEKPYDLFFNAAMSGKIAVVKTLLDRGISFDITSDPDTARISLHNAVQEGFVDIVKFLLKSGVDAGTNASDIENPLLAATWGCNPEIVELLLEAGASTEVKGYLGENLLEIAKNNDCMSVIEILEPHMPPLLLDADY